MQWSAMYGHLEILKFFITALKCSSNFPAQYCRTPLHSAAEGGHLHIMKYLIDEQDCVTHHVLIETSKHRFIVLHIMDI